MLVIRLVSLDVSAAEVLLLFRVSNLKTSRSNRNLLFGSTDDNDAKRLNGCQKLSTVLIKFSSTN
jgi:hypothetical protein